MVFVMKMFTTDTHLDFVRLRVHLTAPPTTVSFRSDSSSFLRHGFILAITLDDGSAGFGVVIIPLFDA